MLAVLVILLVIAIFGGFYGGRAGWGPYGWSPFGVLVLVIVILLLTGRL